MFFKFVEELTEGTVQCWDWHQSEGMAKLTTSLNAFFKTRKSAKRLEISPFARFPYVRRWSGYPPKLSVTADVPARQPSADIVVKVQNRPVIIFPP
jgi:hypothetical protein